MSSSNNGNNNNNSNNNNNPQDDKSWTWGDVAWSVVKWIAWEAFVIGSTYLVSSAIVAWAKKSNPSLTDQQADSLNRLLTKAVTDYRFNSSRDLESTITAILVLIAPEGTDITAVFASMINDTEIDPQLSPEQQEGRQMPTDVEFMTTKTEDDCSDVLISKYGLDHDRVLRIPLELRQALLTHLQSDPTCPISLEPAIDPTTGHVAPGFTALFQYLNGVPHCFLFESEAIEGWVSHHNTNPVTRQAAHQKEFFQLT